MERGRPLKPDVWEPIKDRLALAESLMNCRWDLPITFEREGDKIIGTCTMQCAADLQNCSIRAAEADIALMMKAAILGLVDKARAR